jgi:TRAP-type C4-dicarboxylate transport system substrate-binding protein
LEDEYGIKILSFNWVQGMRQIVANKPIKNPEDLVGMRIRVPDNLRWQQGVRTAGVEPVALPFGEVYVGMEQKNIDGAGLVYRNITDSRLFEVAKFVNNTNHIYLINFEVISKEFFDSLPPEYQKILVEECDKAGLEASIEMEQGIEMQKKDLERHGMTIVSDVNLPAFRQASERAYQELNLICVRDEIYKEMGKR